MAVVVSEIVRRSEQGVTNPFLCRSNDGTSWFVKGLLSAGAEALRAEWIAGCLAQRMGLPMPEFAIMEISDDLIQSSVIDGVQDLAGGVAFGSRTIVGAQELTFTRAREVPASLQAEILLFDWWIRNDDRVLGPSGGNPNVLFSGDEIWVIDHHNGFSKTFDVSRFGKDHVFRDASAIWTPPWKERLFSRMNDANSSFSDIWDSIPLAFHPEKDDTSEASALERDRISEILAYRNTADFWNIA